MDSISIPRALLLLLLVLLSSWTAARCLPSQSSALLQLKQGFSFHSYSFFHSSYSFDPIFSTSNLTSWLRGSDCCSGWEGVACRDLASSGMVTDLDLRGLHIYGKIDPSLFNLTALVSLDLSDNDFDPAPIPPSFDRLPQLTYLNLSNTHFTGGFTGQVPAGISLLTNLVSLDLSYNYLFLRDPDLGELIRNLGSLRELYLDLVDISADGIEWCRAVSGSTPGLQKLSMGFCLLSGPIDASLSGLSSLTVLRLDGNSLNSEVPEFLGNFSSLSELSLTGCGLKGPLPDSIFRLRSLDVSSNPMLAGYFPAFPNDSVLQSLMLSDCGFTGRIPASIGNLTQLMHLELSHNRFSGWIPASIGNLTQLIHLDLFDNNLSGEIPSDVLWAAAISYMDLSFNNFSGRITASIGNLTQLIHLDLSHNNFSGEISSDVFWGAGISDIILSYNNLNGSIPSSFGEDRRLHNLTMLSLSSNLLSGTIPVSLFRLPALQILRLGYNQLSGHLGEFLNASPMLSEFDLSDNLMQGAIPGSIFNFSGLTYLYLKSNNFSGTLNMDLFGSLTNLSYLDLSNNKLSIQYGEGISISLPEFNTLKLAGCNLIKFPNFLRHQQSMSVLDLSKNKIGGAIPRWVWTIGRMSYLNLSHNLFTDVEGPFPELPTDYHLFILDLHSNKLRGPIPLPPFYVNVLDYSNNNFTSSIPSNISSYLNYTSFFSLSNNSLNGGIPLLFCQAKVLKVFDLSENHLNGSIPTCLMDGSISLFVLNLRGNQLHGTMPPNISDPCVLRTINLNGNQIEGKVPRSLNNCKMLEVLDIGNNHMFDTFPFWLANLSKLRVLSLKSNGFYGPIDHHLAGNASYDIFSMLQIFDISYNHFNGSLSSEFFTRLRAMMVGNLDASNDSLGFIYQNTSDLISYQDMVTVVYKGKEITLVKILTIFTSMDLSNNMFVGNIPKNIGGLKSLHILNMSHNSFEGLIPQSIIGMKQLESLDLSSNHLSGEILEKMIDLTFLSLLNLSNNSLVGRIPQGGQFWTFDKNAFDENEGLCGQPLLKPCNGSINATTASEGEPPSRDGKKTDIIVLGIFIGSGFGVGLGVAILLVLMLQHKRRHKRVSSNPFR